MYFDRSDRVPRLKICIAVRKTRCRHTPWDSTHLGVAAKNAGPYIPFRWVEASPFLGQFKAASFWWGGGSRASRQARPDSKL